VSCACVRRAFQELKALREKNTERRREYSAELIAIGKDLTAASGEVKTAGDEVKIYSDRFAANKALWEEDVRNHTHTRTRTRTHTHERALSAPLRLHSCLLSGALLSGTLTLLFDVRVALSWAVLCCAVLCCAVHLFS
jgi:hypothetical protein